MTTEIQMINQSKYPISRDEDKNSAAYKSLLQTCRDQLDHQGFVSLPSFLQPEHVDALITNILELEGVGFYSTEKHNVFLEENDSPCNKSLHPRCIQLKSSKLLIHAKDLAPHASDLDNLFQSTPFLHFISDVLQTKLYPSTDDYGKYYANIFHVGDQLSWHFDRSEFSISLILQPAEEGGEFQFVPNSRGVVDGWEEMRVGVNELTQALGMVVHKPNLASGDLYLFRGQNSLHRVSQITKGRRINVILTFNTKPNVVLNNYTLKKFFGVTRP